MKALRDMKPASAIQRHVSSDFLMRFKQVGDTVRRAFQKMARMLATARMAALFPVDTEPSCHLCIARLPPPSGPAQLLWLEVSHHPSTSTPPARTQLPPLCSLMACLSLHCDRSSLADPGQRPSGPQLPGRHCPGVGTTRS